MALAHTEIERQTAVAIEAARLGKAAHLPYKSGLADTGLATDIDHLPALSGEACANTGLEMLEFRSAPDKGTAARHCRLPGDALQAPDAYWRVDTFE